jgi:RHS repeat-associated protein
VSEYLNSTDQVTAHFEYDPFGNTVVNTDTANQFAYRFSTKPIDIATGLYYYGYRYYDPMTGRWPSRDPIEESGGINLYSFVINSPLGTVDQYGLMFNVSFLEKWVADKIDGVIQSIGNGISEGARAVKDEVGNYFSSKWTSSIGTNFTSTWGLNKGKPIVNTPYLEVNWGGSLNVNGYTDSDTCKDCVQVYGTVGATILGKAPLGNPLINLVFGGNASVQTTWIKCKDNVTGEYETTWKELYLVVTPRIGLRIGGEIGGYSIKVAAYGEGGGWLSWSKNLLAPSERAEISGGWYLSGNFTIASYERRFTLSNGSPNF